MARKKQQKKRLKKYKGKYVTADRLDMSKGGRVGYQRGGPKRKNDPIESKDVFGNVSSSQAKPIGGRLTNEQFATKSPPPKTQTTNKGPS